MAKGEKQGEKRKNKKRRKNERTAGEPPRVAGKRIRRLERRVDELTREQKALRKRLKQLTHRLDAEAVLPPLPPGPPFGGGRGLRPGAGGPPWVKGLGPVVSLEVPLETDDPTAPLWATVSARLPEEITAVGDDGRVVRYRYSAAGSTPQAPRYRPLAGPDAPTPEPSPG